jgi:hypothetical protein
MSFAPSNVCLGCCRAPRARSTAAGTLTLVWDAIPSRTSRRDQYARSPAYRNASSVTRRCQITDLVKATLYYFVVRAQHVGALSAVRSVRLVPGDVNGDACDLIWRNYATGANAVWQGAARVSSISSVSPRCQTWRAARRNRRCQ